MPQHSSKANALSLDGAAAQSDSSILALRQVPWQSGHGAIDPKKYMKLQWTILHIRCYMQPSSVRDVQPHFDRPSTVQGMCTVAVSAVRNLVGSLLGLHLGLHIWIVLAARNVSTMANIPTLVAALSAAVHTCPDAYVPEDAGATAHVLSVAARERHTCSVWQELHTF
jgi:hypothetical protein